MLENINLDDQKFSGIAESGKERIPELTSEWTDYNAHDPGITFLELFAWKKEMQQYRMNRIGEQHRRKYLELLGSRQREAQAAEALLHIPCSREILLPAGTLFHAGDIPFETAEEEYLSPYHLTGMICRRKGQDTEYDLMNNHGSLNLPLFGDPAEKENAFLLRFDGPLPEGHLLHVYFDIRDEGRNPFEDSFIPLSSVCMEALTEKGWKKVTVILDETHGFLTGGRISFRLPAAMKAQGKEFLLRFTLEEAGYDKAPLLDHLGIHRVKVVQKRTWAECISVNSESSMQPYGFRKDSEAVRLDYYVKETDGYRPVPGIPDSSVPFLAVCSDADFYESKACLRGNGFPDQSFDLEMPDLTSEGFRLLAETEEGSGLFTEWEFVDHFEASGPEDRHFTLEDDTILFGNGYHGMMPEGEIRIVSCHTCLGAEGNVKANAITACDQEDVKVITHTAAAGGQNRESMDQALQRAAKALKEVNTAVTLSDFEDLAGHTPGLIVKACSAACAPGNGNTIILSVSPGDRNRKISSAYLDNVTEYMKERIPIGTDLRVTSCRYVGITVYLEVSSPYFGETVKAAVKEKIQSYFDQISGNAGCLITKSDLFGLLENMPVISAVRSISIETPQGGALKTVSGDIQLPPGGLAWLKDLQCMVSSAE